MNLEEKKTNEDATIRCIRREWVGICTKRPAAGTQKRLMERDLKKKRLVMD